MWRLGFDVGYVHNVLLRGSKFARYPVDLNVPRSQIYDTKAEFNVDSKAE